MCYLKKKSVAWVSINLLLVKSNNLFVESQLHTSRDVPANIIFPAVYIPYIHMKFNIF